MKQTHSAIAQMQLVQLLERLTSQQSVQLPYKLNESHPSKRAQSGLFDDGGASTSTAQAIDSRVVLACFGETVVFQRILVDVAGCFEYGVVLSQLLDVIKDHGTNGCVVFTDFLEIASRKTGLSSKEIEDDIVVMDSSLRIFMWDTHDQSTIGINTAVLFNRLKQVVSEQSERLMEGYSK